MEVTDKLVDNLASLSRLSFNDAEKQEIKSDLVKMIAFVEKLQEVDTTGTEPLLHMTSVTDAFREDVVKGSMPKNEALQNAPLTDADYFKVPKVIRK